MNKILNREHIEEEIKKLLTNYQENCKDINFKKGIYIYGSPGCGKTYFITEILKELNYDIIKYDAGDVRNKTLIETITSNNISSQNVLNMMARKPKKIVIIMDEIDGMNNGDKGGITALIKLIRQKKTKKQKMEHMSMNPIICIGNYYIDKKIKELMKVCNTFELKTPTLQQMCEIIKTRMPDILQHCIHSEKAQHSAIVHANTIFNKRQSYGDHSDDPMFIKILDYIQGDLRKIEFIENELLTNFFAI
jgi:SpoVK/Ycf46/Vps4 family AAA+-type ATPase